MQKFFFSFFSITFSFLFLSSCSQSSIKEVRLLMGTLNEIQINGLSKKRAHLAAEKGFAAMNRVDTLMSHYKETSEVSRIKNLLPFETTKVSKETFDVLKRSKKFHELSYGAFDITIGPLVKRWGFFDKEERPLPTKGEIADLRRLCGSVHLFLDDKKREVSKRFPQLEVDLGAIAKGYAVDLALEALKKAGVDSATVNSGGNIGFLGTSSKGDAWEIGIKDPLNPNQLLGVLKIKEGAVATSGNYENFFDINGKRYAHIIDPRNGWPVQGVLSVTVVAPTAMDADALSTTLFVMGPKLGLPLAEKLNAKALFVLDKGNGQTELVWSPELKEQFVAIQ